MCLRISLLAILLVWLTAAIPAEESRQFTPAEFSSELERLSAAAQAASSDPGVAAKLLPTVPVYWQVRTSQRTFELPTEWARSDLGELVRGKNATQASDDLRNHIASLRAEVATYDSSPADTAAMRTALAAILSRPEFQDVRGPTWWDRLKQRLAEWLQRLLMRIFHKSSIPPVDKPIIFVLVGLAVAALAWWAYRRLREQTRMEALALSELPVSAKEWTLWMKEARDAAARGDWREAIHRAYWAGISYLEASGVWRPDKARTPREYLRLLPFASEHSAPLQALTRNFEVVWYAGHHADQDAFAQTLAELEKLGCR
jgi:hypothetical protein